MSDDWKNIIFTASKWNNQVVVKDWVEIGESKYISDVKMSSDWKSYVLPSKDWIIKDGKKIAGYWFTTISNYLYTPDWKDFTFSTIINQKDFSERFSKNEN